MCRELGYKLGAREALGNSYFGPGGGKIVIEELVQIIIFKSMALQVFIFGMFKEMFRKRG